MRVSKERVKTMISVANIRTRKKSSLRPGTYRSEVKSVSYDEAYANETMLKFTYCLQDKQGNTYSFLERFENRRENPRSADFFDYLDRNGISLDELEQFEGCRESLTLRWNLRHGKKFLTITNREFLADNASNDKDGSNEGISDGLSVQ